MIRMGISRSLLTLVAMRLLMIFGVTSRPMRWVTA